MEPHPKFESFDISAHQAFHSDKCRDVCSVSWGSSGTPVLGSLLRLPVQVSKNDQNERSKSAVPQEAIGRARA